MACAVAELEEYVKHHADEDYVWYEGELPESLDNLEEGPPVLCEECNKVVFEGYEECVSCGDWDDSPSMVWSDDKGGMLCKKCK